MSEKPWDKFILIAVSVAVVALSAMFAMKALGFSELFTMREATPKQEFPPTDEPIAKIAKNFVEKEQFWKTPNIGKGDTPVPLFVSIPIVEKDGQLINMWDPDAMQLRPPVSNQWLLQNSLDFLSAGVLEQDPDGDGYTSREEWDAKTDPKDPSSRPPYADKLLFVSREQQEYKLRFSARPDAERFQIVRLPTRKWPNQENFYLRVGETSDDGQFRVDSFEEKTARSAAGINVDASVLNITHLPKQEKFQLIRRVDQVIPTYFAQMQFSLDPSFKEYVKEGETFNLVKDPETKYRVTKVNEDSVVITYQTGAEPEQTVEIKKK